MSVLSCNRSDCENVMCDRYSDAFGYICNECFEELVARGVNTDISKFMDEKVRKNFNKNAVQAYFNEIFPTTREY